ncbi:MAG: hypothetical protein ABI650_05680 [Dokdonella sp.]
MRNVLLLAMCMGLAACGVSRERVAADACLAEAGTRLQGKRIDVDIDKLAASASTNAPETYQLSAPIVFDRGLSSEYSQTIECRVRFNAEQPSVIFLQFNWNLDDLMQGSGE